MEAQTTEERVAQDSAETHGVNKAQLYGVYQKSYDRKAKIRDEKDQLGLELSRKALDMGHPVDDDMRIEANKEFHHHAAQQIPNWVWAIGAAIAGFGSLGTAGLIATALAVWANKSDIPPPAAEVNPPPIMETEDAGLSFSVQGIPNS